MLIVSLVLAVALYARSAPPISNGTFRLSAGSPQVDGRLYKPHAARVRLWIGSDESRPRAIWTNVLRLGDSAGRPVMRWVTTGTSVNPRGETIRWELRQTYDAQPLAPYSILRTSSTGAASALRIDGRRFVGARRAARDAPVE